MTKTLRTKLKTAIRAQLRMGFGPCSSMRRALAVLQISGYGVQGEDDERGAEHFEMWPVTDAAIAADGHYSTLSVDLIGGKWMV